MKYLVVQVTTEEVDPFGSFDGETDEWQPLKVADVRGIIMCDSMSLVGQAIAKITSAGCDWAVFEIVGDKCMRRTVTFGQDHQVVELTP